MLSFGRQFGGDTIISPLALLAGVRPIVASDRADNRVLNLNLLFSEARLDSQVLAVCESEWSEPDNEKDATLKEGLTSIRQKEFFTSDQRGYLLSPRSASLEARIAIVRAMLLSYRDGEHGISHWHILEALLSLDAVSAFLTSHNVDVSHLAKACETMATTAAQRFPA